MQIIHRYICSRKLGRQRICIPINSKALITNVACRLSFNFIRLSCLHEQRAFPITRWRQNMYEICINFYILSWTRDKFFRFFIANSQKNETKLCPNSINSIVCNLFRACKKIVFLKLSREIVGVWMNI